MIVKKYRKKIIELNFFFIFDHKKYRKKNHTFYELCGMINKYIDYT